MRRAGERDERGMRGGGEGEDAEEEKEKAGVVGVRVRACLMGSPGRLMWGLSEAAWGASGELFWGLHGDLFGLLGALLGSHEGRWEASWAVLGRSWRRAEG